MKQAQHAQHLELTRRARVVEACTVYKARNQGHLNISAVARQLKEDRRYVKRWAEKWRQQHHTNNSPRSGRPSFVKNKKLRALIQQALAERDVRTAAHIQCKLQEKGWNVCESTIKNTLHSMKYVFKLARWSRVLTQTAKDRRLKWAYEHRDFDGWRATMFTDSSYFMMGKKSGEAARYSQAKWVHRDEVNLLESCYQRNSLKIHVYGGISYQGKTELYATKGTTGYRSAFTGKGVGAEEYCQLLQDHMLPKCNKIFSSQGITKWYWMQDGAKAHTAKRTKDMLHDEHIEVLPWAAWSADCNPIENIWAYLKTKLAGRSFTTIDAFMGALKKQWAEMPEPLVKNCIDSMHRRVEAVITAEGGPIEY